MTRLLLSKHRDLVTGAVAQVLQYGAALLLLPLIATRLSQAEIGVWYVFVAIQGLSTLVDFGFQPNIARAFAATFAGAPELLREGVSRARTGAPNLELAEQILASSRRLYLILALGVAVLLFSAGTLYISGLVRGEAIALGSTRLAWFIFSTSVAINLYFLWAAPLLMGSGRVHQNYLSVIIMRGGFSVLGAAALLAGGGLVALAAMNLVSVLAGSIYARVALRPVLDSLAGARRSTRDNVLGSLWYNSSRTGLVLVGGFLINRANVLVFSTFVGLTESARYAFTLQILSAGMALAQLPTMAAVPRMTALRVQGETRALARLFLRRHAFLLSVFALYSVLVGVVGQWGLHMIGSRIDLMPTGEYALFCAVLLLELNSINAGYLLSTGNRVPFVRSALISGIAVLSLSLVAVHLGWGVLGAIVAQGVVQLAYNNWKWPFEAWKELKAWI